MGSKGKPYRTVMVDGWEVLVGRGSEENEVLTFEVAEPHDIWMHVGGGTPGSHVVIKNPGKAAVPNAIVEAAAAICAHFSKARGAAKVAVDYCPASHVSKPRGAPMGMVEIEKYKTIKVAPQAPSSER